MQIPSKDKMEYRKGVNAFVINDNQEFLLVCKKNYGDNQWDCPGGGLDQGEDVKEGLLRELEEELGSKDFKILSESSIKNKFEWPDEAIIDGYNKRSIWYRGQEKYQFLVKYLGNESELKIQEEEIKKVKWVKYENLEDHLIFDGQWELAKTTIEDFKKSGYLDF